MSIRKSGVKILLVLLFLTAVLVSLFLAKPGKKEPAEVILPTEETTLPTEPTEPVTEEITQPTEPDLSGIPECLLELMEKNPETVDFVLNYPNREKQTVDITGLSREEVPLFLQWDQRWGYTIYGTDVLALTGCGPTCMAMVGYYLTGDEGFTPDKMAQFCLDNGYYAWGNGTEWRFFSEGAQKLGLKSRELSLSQSVMVSHLDKGHPIVINVRKGDFTEHGHYIVAVGCEDGMFRINDPNSIIRSEQLWSYDTLKPQIRNLWAIWKE